MSLQYILYELMKRDVFYFMPWSDYIAIFAILKSLYSDTKILSKYIPSLQKRLQTIDFHIVIMYKDKETLSRNERGRFGTFKSDSTHHFFRNACTKTGSLQFSQFSGCWLILSVHILMSFDFPFARLLGVR
jgi:hypothetical protein